MAIVCQTCGISGFSSSFVFCSTCKISVQHRYCIGTGLLLQKTESWLCEECKSKPLNQFKHTNSGAKFMESPNKESGGKPSSCDLLASNKKEKVVKTLKESDEKGKEAITADSVCAMKETGKVSMDNLVDEAGNNLDHKKEQFIGEQMSEDMEISEDDCMDLGHTSLVKDTVRATQWKGKEISVDKLTYDVPSKDIGISGANYIDLDPSDDEKADMSVLDHPNNNKKKAGSEPKDDNISKQVRIMGMDFSVDRHMRSTPAKECTIPHSQNPQSSQNFVLPHDLNVRRVDEVTPMAMSELNFLFPKKVPVKKSMSEFSFLFPKTVSVNKRTSVELSGEEDMQSAENMTSLMEKQQVDEVTPKAMGKFSFLFPKTVPVNKRTSVELDGEEDMQSAENMTSLMEKQQVDEVTPKSMGKFSFLIPKTVPVNKRTSVELDGEEDMQSAENMTSLMEKQQVDEVTPKAMGKFSFLIPKTVPVNKRTSVELDGEEDMQSAENMTSLMEKQQVDEVTPKAMGKFSFLIPKTVPINKRTSVELDGEEDMQSAENMTSLMEKQQVDEVTPKAMGKFSFLIPKTVPVNKRTSVELDGEEDMQSAENMTSLMEKQQVGEVTPKSMGKFSFLIPKTVPVNKRTSVELDGEEDMQSAENMTSLMEKQQVDEVTPMPMSELNYLFPRTVPVKKSMSEFSFLFPKTVPVNKRTSVELTGEEDMQSAENMTSLMGKQQVLQQPLWSDIEKSEVVTPRYLNLFPLGAEELGGKTCSGSSNDLNLELTLRSPSPSHVNAVSPARFSLSDAKADGNSNI